MTSLLDEEMGDSEDSELQLKPEGFKSVNVVRSKRIDLDLNDIYHWFTVNIYDTHEAMIKALTGAGVWDKSNKTPDDAVAFCDTWSTKESLENGVGDWDCAGHVYLVDTSLNTIAHESTHMALGILARTGLKKLAVVTGDADENEESLCELVGFITQEVNTAVIDLVATDKEAK